MAGRIRGRLCSLIAHELPRHFDFPVLHDLLHDLGHGIIPMTNIAMNTRSEVTEVLQTLMDVKIQPYVSSGLVDLSLEGDDLHHPDS